MFWILISLIIMQKYIKLIIFVLKDGGAFYLSSYGRITSSNFVENYVTSDDSSGNSLRIEDGVLNLISCDFSGDNTPFIDNKQGGTLYNYCSYLETDSDVRTTVKSGNTPLLFQDCYSCPSGQYGGYRRENDDVCLELCPLSLTENEITCYDCPFEKQCLGILIYV